MFIYYEAVIVTVRYMAESNVIDMDSMKFSEVLGSTKKLVAVEFYTPTCPICQAMVPVYSQVASELSGKALFTKVDASRNSELSSRFGIMGVPAFKFFCDGKELGGIVGMTNATALGNTVKDFIRHGATCKSTSLVLEMDGYG